VEGRNFDTRKHLLQYDDVMNKQREEIYALRKEILTGKLGRDYIIALAEDVAEDYVDRHCPPAKDPSEWDGALRVARSWTRSESSRQRKGSRRTRRTPS